MALNRVLKRIDVIGEYIFFNVQHPYASRNYKLKCFDISANPIEQLRKKGNKCWLKCGDREAFIHCCMRMQQTDATPMKSRVAVI